MMKRNANLDLIRVVALLMVFCRHFLTGSGVYGLEVNGASGLALVFTQIISLSGVSLFIMLTGYLCCKKEFSFKYYLGIVRIYLVYVLASLACLIFSAFYLGHELSLHYVFSAIFNHYACGDYSWYVIMYTGLFLLIPFLNLIYNNLPSKLSKIVLIGTLVYLTAIPLISNTFIHIYTTWWDNLYPLAYYFLGAFLREYKPELGIKKAALVLISLLFVYSAMDYWNIASGALLWPTQNSYEGLKAMTVTLAIFVFLLNVDLSRNPQCMGRIIEKISLLSFNIYLLSYISDKFVYSVLMAQVSSLSARMWLAPVTIFVSLVMAFVMGWLLNFPAKFLDKTICSALLKLNTKKTALS